MASLVFVSFAVLVYLYVSKDILNSQLNAMVTLNNTFQTQVDHSLRDLDSVSTNINYSSLSKSILDENFELNISNDILEELSELFITISGSDLKADQIDLYDFSGNVLRTGVTTKVATVTWDNDELIAQAQALGGTKVISEPYVSEIFSAHADSDHWFISIYRAFINQHGKVVGTIETAKRCKSVFGSIISFSLSQPSKALFLTKKQIVKMLLWFIFSIRMEI